VVMCLGQGADFHMTQLMSLPLTISCSSESRLVLPSWYQLTRVVPDIIHQGHKTVVFVRVHVHVSVCVCAIMNILEIPKVEASGFSQVGVSDLSFLSALTLWLDSRNDSCATYPQVFSGTFEGKLRANWLT